MVGYINSVVVYSVVWREVFYSLRFLLVLIMPCLF